MTISSLAIIAGIAYFSGRVIYLDIAMVYGILSFLGVLVVARYLEKGL
jgi:multicomponent Na+:H+ antiporter subunit F